VESVEDPNFGFMAPAKAPGVPEGIMSPRDTWADKDAYDKKARELVDLFVENFTAYRADATEGVKRVADRIGAR